MTFKIAVIREDACIGCTKCLVACPVDAIIGAQKFMHTVIEQECIGCDLCVPVCPVDCIDMVTVEKPLFDPETVKKRRKNRRLRLQIPETSVVVEKKAYMASVLSRIQKKKDKHDTHQNKKNI